MTRLQVDIVHDDGDWSAFEPVEPAIEAAANAVAGHVARQLAGQSGREVCIALSSDAAVTELNGKFRGKLKPTNVLSFPSQVGESLGDVVLAAETVLKEAQEQAIPPQHHLQHLVAHGILHLLGFDHETAHDAERMEAIEIEILAKLGIENPYTEPLEGDTFARAQG